MPYQCTECGRLFREISNLYRHRNSRHAGVGGYNVIREYFDGIIILKYFTSIKIKKEYLKSVLNILIPEWFLKYLFYKESIYALIDCWLIH